jgi:glycosyltransferase involved in cell wall biosynthesis
MESDLFQHSNQELPIPTGASGVSVIICCHNSGARLPETLRHLALQQVPADLLWEVIVVDNHSADDTADVAISSWPKDAPAPLRVTHEPELGLSHARERGRLEAKYAFISLVDDDNWVEPDWIAVVNEVLASHPEVAACGGDIEAACETEPPHWFASQQRNFAVGVQGASAGYIADPPGYLFGAGLNIRRSAWEDLLRSGFEQIIGDRKGAGALGGGDLELCFALRLAGWKLWYDPRLKLRHFIPSQRLRWSYLRRLYRGTGVVGVHLEPYIMALREMIAAETDGHGVRPNNKLLHAWEKCVLNVSRILHGNFQLLLRIELVAAHELEYLRQGRRFEEMVQRIRNAPWRKRASSS